MSITSQLGGVLRTKCTEPGCEGTLSTNAFGVKFKGYWHDAAYPCKVCGRLYWWSDLLPAHNYEGEKAFVVDGTVVFRAV